VTGTADPAALSVVLLTALLALALPVAAASAPERLSWTSHTEVRLGGELIRIEQGRSRLLADGSVSTELSSIEKDPPGPDGARPRTRRRLERAIAERRVALDELIGRYLRIDRLEVPELVGDGTVTPGRTDRGDERRLQVRNVVRVGDALDVWVDAASDRPRRLSVLTSLEGEPVRIEATFGRLDDGTRTIDTLTATTEIGETELIVRRDNSEFVRGGE